MLDLQYVEIFSVYIFNVIGDSVIYFLFQNEKGQLQQQVQDLSLKAQQYKVSQ